MGGITGHVTPFLSSLSSSSCIVNGLQQQTSHAAAVLLVAGLQCAAAVYVKQINWSHCLGGNSGHDSPSLSNFPPKFSDISGLCR